MIYFLLPQISILVYIFLHLTFTLDGLDQRKICQGQCLPGSASEFPIAPTVSVMSHQRLGEVTESWLSGRGEEQCDSQLV